MSLEELKNTLKSYNIVQSMSRTANSRDNTVVGTFLKSLKTELIQGTKLVGADVGGAITGGIVGSFAGGIGAAPGAIGGGCGASIGVGISQKEENEKVKRKGVVIYLITTP